MTTETFAAARIEADPTLPIIHITRDFDATVEQVMRAHTDPELFARWVGPASMVTKIDHWDARDGGSWRFASVRDDFEAWFRGCFHQVTDHRIVQTFTWEQEPDGVALETLRIERRGGDVHLSGRPGRSAGLHRGTTRRRASPGKDRK